MVDQTVGPRHRAIRLLIEFDGDQLRVIDQREIDTATPPSDSLKGFEGESGFWIELRDANEQPLYRRVMQSPIQQEVEAFDPDGSATRHVVERRQGVFSVVVPDVAGADHVAVVSSPRAAHEIASKPADVLARLPIRAAGGPR